MGDPGPSSYCPLSSEKKTVTDNVDRALRRLWEPREDTLPNLPPRKTSWRPWYLSWVLEWVEGT